MVCKREWRTLSSSTIQLPSSSSLPSWYPSSLTIWLTDTCVKPRLCANCSACVVLPTPGVPVITIFGFLRAMLQCCRIFFPALSLCMRSRSQFPTGFPVVGCFAPDCRKPNDESDGVRPKCRCICINVCLHETSTQTKLHHNPKNFPARQDKAGPKFFPADARHRSSPH